MQTQSLKSIVALGALLAAAHPVASQIVRVDFTSEITQVVGDGLTGVQVGGIITGRVTVDLAYLPEDTDPWDSVGSYAVPSPATPGYTLAFDTGFEAVTFDSINAANDPGPTPGIFLFDGAGGRDWIGFQMRHQDNPYAASLSFEDYSLPQSLVRTDYFPEAMNLPEGMERAMFQYYDSVGTDSVVARVTAASYTVDTGGIVTGVLQYRVKVSDLPRYKKLALLTSLRLAETSFKRGRCRLGLKHLEHFQRKVRLLVTRRDARLAYVLHHGAEAIIDTGCGK